MLFNDGHMSRAMCCRVDRDDRPLTGLPQGYRAQHLDLGCVTRVTDTRNVDKSSPISVNWNMADNSVEVTDATRGRTTRYHVIYVNFSTCITIQIYKHRHHNSDIG